ncbi:MAG TPA: hypothetical protein VHQ86_00600, partial [Candidatus Saccharimonadia bacterium]|nr:hypothetical protein [Candidatus Saccharimonadia bacterium]
MHKLSYKLTLATGAAVVALSGATVYAVSSHANAHAQDAGQASPTPKTSHAHAADTGNAHLAAAQLKACQNRQAAVQNIISRIVDRGTKQIGVFNDIATRTETFYTTKGKTVANYAVLVAAVNDAKTKAETDIADLKTNDTFDCSSNDPKGGVHAFQADLKTEIADLKVYKTAVK